jgi:hypothetical protein
LTLFQNNKLYQTDLYQNTLDPTPSNINNNLNSVVGFLNNVSSNMSGLNNENKFPIIFSNTCSTGRFYDQDAMPECFLFYSKGVIGFIDSIRLGWAYPSLNFNIDFLEKCIIYSLKDILLKIRIVMRVYQVDI